MFFLIHSPLTPRGLTLMHGPLVAVPHTVRGSCGFVCCCLKESSVVWETLKTVHPPACRAIGSDCGLMERRRIAAPPHDLPRI